jgi:hypothetical protein
VYIVLEIAALGSASFAMTKKMKGIKMKSLKQTITLFAIICLAIGGFVAAQITTERVTYTISGTVGLPGVIMKGLPGNPISDSSGFYTATVGFDWAGTVQPFMEGYEFTPPAKIYSAVTNNQTNQNYRASVLTFIISGRTGVAGVRMRGLPGEPVTGPNGSYSASVAYGWSGLIAPQKEGYEFDPPEILYTNVSSNFTSQDYTAAPRKYTISGSTGISNVTMRGFPEIVVTDRDGSYRVTVAYGWSGTVTPVREGYTFEPASRIYNKLIRDRYSDSYNAKLKHHTISGTILSNKGEPVEGVLVTSDGAGTAVTDSSGKYAIYVEYGWKGTLMPVQEGYSFTPRTRPIPVVTRDQTNQNYKAEVQMLTITDTLKTSKNESFVGGQIKAIPGDISSVTDSRGQYSIQVPYGWTGEIQVTPPPEPGGVEFEPITVSYNNVTTDIINGIPAPSRPTMGAGAILPNSRILTQVSRTGTGRMLIIPAEDIEQQDVLATREDMQVMAEILDERFREPRMIEGVFRDFGDFFGRDNRKTEAVYMQGYGVIFMMEVDHSFSKAPQTQEQTNEEKNQQGDSTWQEARARVLSPGGTRARRDVSEREYETQMVGILKTELIRALKYAANIRNLQPDEWVILSVAGNSPQVLQEFYGSLPTPSGSSSYGSSSGYGGGYIAGGSSSSYGYGGGMGGMMGGYGGGGYGGGMMVSYGSGGMMGGYGGGMMGGYGMRTPSASVLTMRIKKSDVDEFASDKLDFEKFREKVQIFMY